MKISKGTKYSKRHAPSDPMKRYLLGDIIRKKSTWQRRAKLNRQTAILLDFINSEYDLRKLQTKWINHGPNIDEADLMFIIKSKNHEDWIKYKKLKHPPTNFFFCFICYNEYLIEHKATIKKEGGWWRRVRTTWNREKKNDKSKNERWASYGNWLWPVISGTISVPNP